MPSTTLRGLQVLEALAGMTQPASMSAVSAHVGVSQSQVFRLLQTLERERYVEHLGRDGYRLGSHAVALGMLIGPRPALARAVHPTIWRLAATTGEAVVLHLRSGAHRVLILGIPSPSGPVRDPAAVLGERSPLGIGASGRVILAYLPPNERRTIGPQTDEQALDGIRAHGYELSFGENHPGVNGISAPLLTADETPLGAITIAGPIARLNRDALLTHAALLTNACRTLSPIVASLLGPDPGKTLRALDIDSHTEPGHAPETDAT